MKHDRAQALYRQIGRTLAAAARKERSRTQCDYCRAPATWRRHGPAQSLTACPEHTPQAEKDWTALVARLNIGI